MHYRNGREAKNGDKVVMIPAFGPPIAGFLHDAVAGNDDCNGRLAVATQNDPYVNLRECLHADDVAAATVPDSTKPPVAADTMCNTGELARVYGELNKYKTRYGAID